KWRKFWGVLYRESSCSTARLELFEGSTVPFLLETTDKRYLLAADSTEAAAWIQKLCELAFPRSREEQAAGKDGQQSSLGTDGKFSMEENSLYSSRGKGRHREVGKPSESLFSWPYRFLRRFGRDKVTFSFEAGRRCASGEGNFEFETRQGNEIFQAIESAINVHRG
ncbi:PREDICTED: docking protein 2-like, partial [Fulmarus glacialis]|uniref:docking protein 2-like n=1 Tax=Fulmarus glacialis TaxID=30455 RepID=UPI00051ADF16